jgi:hypothetical protein
MRLDKLDVPTPRGKGQRQSAGRLTAKQALAQAGHAEKIRELHTARLEHGQTLAALFPKKGASEPDRIDLSFLLDFPYLCIPLAEGFLKWGKSGNITQLTRLEKSRALNLYWCRYLRENHLHNITFALVDDQVLAGFNQWLHGPLNQTKGKKGQPLHPSTIGRALSTLRLVAGHGLAERIPAGPRGAARKSVPTEVLSQNELATIWVAAEKEVLILRERWMRGCFLLEKGRQGLANGNILSSNPRTNSQARSDENRALCLAMLDAAYPGVVPSLQVIRAANVHLGRTVQYAFGSGELRGYLCATGRDIVPLVLLIALATAFNADTVLKLNWSNVDRNVDRLGLASVAFDVREERSIDESVSATSPLLKIKGDKPRSNRQLLRLLDPTASDDSQVSLNLVLDLLRDITKRIRPSVSSDHSDRLFLFAPVTRKCKSAKGFGYDQMAVANDVVWKNSLQDFIRTHDLPPFTLKTLRATLLDYVQLVNRGDLEKARQVGNHSGRVTTWTHYTSGLVRALLMEATGETLLSRDRWIDSKGLVDPRRTGLDDDKGCATPGFGCHDPFDSPRVNQRPGRLCDAYGECPACPLKKVRPGNSDDVRWWEALQRAIYRSITSLPASMWQERWAPVVSDLNALVALVPDEVLVESRRFLGELPNVG